jgi:hypothetical protein
MIGNTRRQYQFHEDFLFLNCFATGHLHNAETFFDFVYEFAELFAIENLLRV